MLLFWWAVRCSAINIKYKWHSTDNRSSYLNVYLYYSLFVTFNFRSKVLTPVIGCRRVHCQCITRWRVHQNVKRRPRFHDNSGNKKTKYCGLLPALARVHIVRLASQLWTSVTLRENGSRYNQTPPGLTQYEIGQSYLWISGIVFSSKKFLKNKN